jgi:hypothetical protein
MHSRKRPVRALCPQHSSARRGFTLFDLSIAWPSVNWMYRRQRLEQGAELVRARLGSARVNAVETGLVYQFRFEPGGRRFLILPYDAEALEATDTSLAPPGCCPPAPGSTEANY